MGPEPSPLSQLCEVQSIYIQYFVPKDYQISDAIWWNRSTVSRKVSLGLSVLLLCKHLDGRPVLASFVGL